MAKSIAKLEVKVDATHDAVLKLPQSLADEFATKEELRSIRKDLNDIRRALWLVGSAIAVAVITAVLRGVEL